MLRTAHDSRSTMPASPATTHATDLVVAREILRAR